MGMASVLWALSSWLTLLPVRIAYVQLTKLDMQPRKSLLWGGQDQQFMSSG